MKDWKSCFLVLATLVATSLSSRASLQWTRTRDSATSAPHRAEDFFHSCTRPGISFSRVIRDSRSFRSIAPKHRVDSRDNLLQACEVACGAGDTGLQSEHVHRSFVADRGSDRVQTRLDPSSFFIKVLTKFCSQKSVQSTEQNPMASINTVGLKEIPPSTR